MEGMREIDGGRGWKEGSWCLGKKEDTQGREREESRCTTEVLDMNEISLILLPEARRMRKSVFCVKRRKEAR